MILPDLDTRFAGRRGALFGLALRTSLLTVLTLGFYRFWMKTRLRRWYWSAIRPGGHPLEYVGDPLEKLLGFLIAVAFLAFYIGVVNLVLMFLAFTLLGGDAFAYSASFVGLIPVVFYARYRARRYMLARTRWRGIRFGLEPAAWGYAWRAMAHWAVTILSLGLLWPRMTFALEKFRTDRTWFGDARLEQTGRWQSLYRGGIHAGLGALVLLAGAAMLFFADPEGETGDLSVILIAAGLAWFVVGVLHYRVCSFRILTAGKRLVLPGDRGLEAPGEATVPATGLRSAARTGRVLRIQVFGNLLAILLMLLALIPLGVLLALLVGLAEGAFAALSQGAPDVLERLGSAPLLVQGAVGVTAYFAFFILWGVLRQVFVTMPVLAHYAETLTITDPLALAQVHQRGADSFAEADGLAEALDLGAGI